MLDLHYRVLEFCEDSYIKLPATAVSRHGLESTARGCADHYWYIHDGWEAWHQGDGLTFVLHDGENGPELGRYAISYDVEPAFSLRALNTQTS